MMGQTARTVKQNAEPDQWGKKHEGRWRRATPIETRPIIKDLLVAVYAFIRSPLNRGLFSARLAGGRSLIQPSSSFARDLQV
jgi:hypothetical protein